MKRNEQSSYFSLIKIACNLVACCGQWLITYPCGCFNQMEKKNYNIKQEIL